MPESGTTARKLGYAEVPAIVGIGEDAGWPSLQRGRGGRFQEKLFYEAGIA